MTPEQWDRVKSIVADALEQPTAQRAAFVERACDGDASMRREVEKLLNLDDDASAFLSDAPSVAVKAMQAIEETFSESELRPIEAPERIGKYRIKDRIGSGGMGTVFKAIQDQPHRTVALKLLNTGGLSETTIRRFDRESQVLANLHHPCIAHIYEAGVDASGALPTPFIAMELVRDGRTIVAFAQEQKLSPQQCVTLFIKVCAAVQHAHDRGIVHRDLKPANILIDQTGEPKIIDFGVARVVAGDDEPEVTMHTEAGDLIGTLPYMSPEQCSHVRTDIDHRADVYALGVVLFEMLTGRLPIELKGMHMDEAIRAVRAKPPARLARIAPHVSRDLDVITSKALEKDPERRYQTVGEFASDLRNYLGHRPIVARPPSFMYQARLFSRRHRIGVLTATLVFFIMIAATIISGTFAVQRHNALQAETQLRTEYEQVNDILLALLRMPNPHGLGADISFLDVVDRMVAQIDQEPIESPSVEATIRATLGRTYMNLGRLQPAERQLTIALQRFDTIDPDGAPIANVCYDLGEVSGRIGKIDEAERAYRRALTITRQLKQDSGLDQLAILANLANVLVQKGDLDQAEPIAEKVFELRVKQLGANHLSTLTSQRQLARLQDRKGNLTHAETLLEDALQRIHDNFNEQHVVKSTTISQLARVKRKLAKLQEARVLLDEAWQLVRANRTPGSHDWNIAVNTYASLLTEMDRPDDVQALLLDALRLMVKEYDDAHMLVRELRGWLAEVYEQSGKMEEAQAVREGRLP